MLREHLHTHLIKCNRGNRRRDFFASLLFQLSFTSIHLIHTSNFSPPLRKYIFSETLYIIIYAKGEGFYELKFFFFSLNRENLFPRFKTKIFRFIFEEYYFWLNKLLSIVSIFLRYKYSSIPSRKI